MLAADGAASFSAKEGVKGKGGEGICAGGGGGRGAQGEWRGGAGEWEVSAHCLQHQNAGLCGRWHRGSKSVQGCGRWHMGSKECRGVVDGMGAARVCRGCGSRDTYRGTFELLHQLTILLLQLLIQVLNLLLLGLQLLLQLLSKFSSPQSTSEGKLVIGPGIQLCGNQ